MLDANCRPSCSPCAAIGLRLNQLVYRYRTVNLTAHEQEGEAIRALQPGAQVPLLVGDGGSLARNAG